MPLYAKYNNILDNNEPIAPITIPSITNGHLINQSVAPTNFIIPTSLLLEYTVSFIVFMIKNTDTPTNTTNRPIPTIWTTSTNLLIVSITSCWFPIPSTPVIFSTLFITSSAAAGSFKLTINELGNGLLFKS